MVKSTLKILKTFIVKTKTKTLLFVLKAPRDQDFGLDDYITAKISHKFCQNWICQDF